MVIYHKNLGRTHTRVARARARSIFLFIIYLSISNWYTGTSMCRLFTKNSKINFLTRSARWLRLYKEKLNILKIKLIKYN